MNAPLNRAELLHQLLDITRRHVYKPLPEPLGTLGVFHCHRTQKLHAVPVHQPAIIVVLIGEKRVCYGAQETRCHSGEMLLFPGNAEWQMENIPAPDTDEYLALFVPFNPLTLSRFLQGVGSQVDWTAQSLQMNAVAPDDLLLSLYQRIQWTLSGNVDPLLIELRQQELLALCAQQGLLGSLVRNRHPGIVQRVAALLAVDCARDWKIADVCHMLAMSESSLRRELASENSGFRALLEQTRLITALGLLQETRWTVADIAARVGYESPSRFAARFRERFGMSPAEVKNSRESLRVSGARLTDSGALSMP